MPTLRGCKNPEWYQIEKGTLQIFEMPTTSFPPWRFGFWEHPKCKIIQKLNLLKHIMVLTIRMLIIKNLVSVRTLFCSFLEGYLTAIKIWQQCLLSLSLLGEHVFSPLGLKYIWLPKSEFCSRHSKVENPFVCAWVFILTLRSNLTN